MVSRGKLFLGQLLKWGRKLWSAEEATALTFGKDPEKISSEELERNGGPFANYYTRLLEIIIEAQEAKILPQLMQPRMYLEWARRTGINFPKRLDDEVSRTEVEFAELERQREDLRSKNKALDIQIQQLRYQLEVQQAASTKSDDKELGERERDTLLKLVIGLAIKAYRYDPKGGRSSVPKDIATDLEKLGLSVSDDTVRNKLSQASELLPPIIK